MSAARRIVLNILKADQNLKKSLPKKLHALSDIKYREKTSQSSPSLIPLETPSF